MKQETTKDRLYSGKGLIDSPLAIKMRDISYPTLLAMARTKIKYKLVYDNPLEKLEGHPRIFVSNHYSFRDTPIVCNSIGEKAYILTGKQSLRPEDNLFFHLYGSIFVDRKDKEDMALSKLAMETYLKNGQSIIVFPEGTWNLDPAALMLPMKWGIIDVAQNTDAQIIPMTLYYQRDSRECHIQYGTPKLYPKGTDKKEAINSLRDEMSTMLWNKIEKNQPLSRKELDVAALEKEYRSVLEEYPELNPQYEQEIIFRPYTSPEEVFAPVKQLKSKNNKYVNKLIA